MLGGCCIGGGGKPSPYLNTEDARSSGFLRALFQFSERTAGKTAKLDCGGVELFGVVGAAGLECGEPATKARELIWRQLDDSFGDFFDFHVRNIHVSDRGRQYISSCLRRAVSNRPMSQGFCCLRGCIGWATSQSSLSFMLCGFTPPNMSCKPS